MSGKHNHKTTEKTLELLAFIRKFRQDHAGRFPSRRDMAKQFRTGTSVINYYLLNLEKQGYISWIKGDPRFIKINDLQTINILRCPVTGCGHWTHPVYEDGLTCPDHKDAALVPAVFQEL